jgi:hypothetical protein
MDTGPDRLQKLTNGDVLNRRECLKIIFLGASALCWGTRRLKAEQTTYADTPVQFQWRVPIAHYETVKNELDFDGTIEPEKDAKGVPLVFIFVGAVLIPYLAKTVIALCHEIKYGGVVIDTRGEKIIIDTDKSIPGGMVVVVSTEGTEIYDKDEIEKPSALAEVLFKARR